jgi:hypothetical protein
MATLVAEGVEKSRMDLSPMVMLGSDRIGGKKDKLLRTKKP